MELKILGYKKNIYFPPTFSNIGLYWIIYSKNNLDFSINLERRVWFRKSLSVQNQSSYSTFLIGNNWFSQGLGAKISNLTKSSSFITFFVGQKLPWGYKVLGAIIPPSSLRAPVCRHCSRRLNAAPPPSHGCPLIRNWIPIFPLVYD